MYWLEVTTIEPLTALVPRILGGDSSALTELVERALPRLILAARRYGAAQEDAEDIVQAVVYKVSTSLGRLSFDRGGKDPLLNYMIKAVTNSAIQLHRDRDKERDAINEIGRQLRVPPVGTPSAIREQGEGDADIELQELVAPSDPLAGSSAGIEAVSAFLAQLDEEDQLILLLHAEGTLTSREIGESVGVEPASVRQRVKRLHDRFRKEHGHVARG